MPAAFARAPTPPAAVRLAAARLRDGVPTAAERLAAARGVRVVLPRLAVPVALRAALRLLSGVGPEVLAGAFGDGAARAGVPAPAVSRAAFAVASGATAEALRGGVAAVVSLGFAAVVAAGFAPVVSLGFEAVVSLGFRAGWSRSASKRSSSLGFEAAVFQVGFAAVVSLRASRCRWLPAWQPRGWWPWGFLRSCP